jgi:hypothetical protein
MAHRRSAEEWEKLIREFEDSGETAAAFARARGIRPDTLKWWRWRLGREARATKPAASRRAAPRVRLLPVQPVHDVAPRDRETPTPVWELVAPTGYELRVYDRRGLGVLRAALSAVAGYRRR